MNFLRPLSCIGVLLIQLYATTAMADFLRAKSAGEVVNYLTKLPQDSIIFVDVDDTLITPVSKTFRAPPHNQLIDEIKEHRDQYPRYEEIVSNWRLQRKVMLLDHSWPSALTKLKRKFTVYGLTKMDVGPFGNIESMEKWRYNELKSLGIRFSDNKDIPASNINGAMYYRGIIATGANSKSQAIGCYLPYLQTKTMVMIDDRLPHLEDVEAFCNANSIHFVGIWFQGLGTLKDVPNPAIAELQREHLIKHAEWLEDDRAALLIPSFTRTFSYP